MCGLGEEETMALVELEKVSKTYTHAAVTVCALAEATLEIGEGEFVALMGPSGSGKSTILSIVGAMNPPASGRVTVDGLDIYGLSVERLADFRREYLGFVFQQLFLVPYLTAAENVMLPLAAARIPNRRQREMAGEALARVGLADKTTRLPRDLSGGEQQRVAIARAIVNAPPLLLADEPTGCLDSRTGREITGLFERLRQDGLTVFLVTHDAAVAACADRIIHVQDGRVLPAARGARPELAAVAAG
jgi:putative ABC transport system ATP-binding protein